ncbi:Fic family protein [Alteromonas sp. ASW11-36]|uniref:Fic family protein n=1 Tax=Alteromonas arenosi TaxID=3055817 RepID=A0ABT7SST7_9ALTE|nr:Fic family protein [Alteromonas sp. ASW11-36]MDM7859257.1 Fic family protein [Alteromonas sp. ASW11-36]
MLDFDSQINRVFRELSLIFGSTSQLLKNFESMPAQDLMMAKYGIYYSGSLKAKVFEHKIQAFESLYKALMHESSNLPESLLSAHALLHTGHSSFGKLRVRDVYLGQRETMPFDNDNFKPRGSSAVNDAFLKWIEYKKKGSLGCLYSYFWFLNIHPFQDGNGRFSRAYLMSVSDEFCAFPLFIAFTKGQEHNRLVQTIESESGTEHLSRYMSNYFNWLHHLKGRCKLEILNFVQKFQFFLKQLGLSTQLQQVNSLFQEPIFEDVNILSPELKPLITFLKDKKIIKMFKPKLDKPQIHVFLPALRLYDICKKEVLKPIK